MIQAFKDLNRLREIASVAWRHGFGGLLSRGPLGEVLGKLEKVDARPESERESTARRFRLFLSDLGPTFIKLGQILSTRPDLMPADYVQELSLLQDAVSPEPMEHVVKEIEQSFGRPVREIFAWIDETPMASASIAQVHRARTLAGDEVVVKVQRPQIAARIRADLDLLHYLARLLEAVIEETGVYTPVGIIEEFDTSIHEEIDFNHEARNIDEFYRNNASRSYVAIPRVHHELSSRTVLTMELLIGEKIRNIDPQKHNRELIASRVVEVAFRQLFEDGLFHGDPHPGNILVMEGDRLGLLDFGTVGRLTKPMQESLVMLVLAVALKDADTMARILYRIAPPSERTNLAAFKTDIQNVLDSFLTRTTTLDQVDSRQLVPELLNIAVRHHIRIPKEYAILSRASVSMEGLIRGLHPQLKIGKSVMPYAKELLFSSKESSDMGVVGMRALLRLQTYATDVPAQLSQVLFDLESGKFKVNVASQDIERIHQSIRGLGVVVFLGFLICGLTIGAFLSFAKLDFLVRGVPVLGVMAILLIGFLFGVTGVFTFASGRLRRKISIARWLKRRRRDQTSGAQ